MTHQDDFNPYPQDTCMVLQRNIKHYPKSFDTNPRLPFLFVLQYVQTCGNFFTENFLRSDIKLLFLNIACPQGSRCQSLSHTLVIKRQRLPTYAWRPFYGTLANRIVQDVTPKTQRSIWVFFQFAYMNFIENEIKMKNYP